MWEGTDSVDVEPGVGRAAAEPRAAGTRGPRAWLNNKQWDDWIETVTVLVLALASLAAAWSGFQAAQWSGEQSTLYSQASARRIQATQASNAAYTYLVIDVDAFNNFANAYAAGDTELMEFHRRQFSDRLAPAVEAWLATDPLTSSEAAASPLEMPEYVVPERARAAQLEAESEELFGRGVHALEQSGGYVLNTVYLATALFFSGIASKVRGRPARAAIIGMGIILLLVGVYHIVSLPVEGGPI